jgi:hypothetical protein
MAWVRRASGVSYYYRALRDHMGRVVKTYVGRGPIAELAAQLDCQAWFERAAEARKLEAARERLAPAERVAEALGQGCDLLLAAAGSHRPNYCAWRRRHDQALASRA